MTSTIANLRAFCAAHPELPGARRALAHFDGVTVDTHALRTVLGVALAAFRAATAAQLEVAQSGATIVGDAMTACRAHAAALTTALNSLDEALVRIQRNPGSPEP